MKTTKQKLIDFVEGCDVVYLNDSYAEKIGTAIEIDKVNLDLMTTINSRPKDINTNSQDELLFVLFFMFIDGYEYNHTLGCATYLHVTKDFYYYLYTSLCVKVSRIIKLVCCDESKYNVPSNIDIYYITCNHKPFSAFMSLFDRFVDDIMEVDKVIIYLQSINTKCYDRIVDLTNHDIGNFLHTDCAYRKSILHFTTTKSVLEKLHNNLLFIQKFVKHKNKFNFVIRNAKKIQSLPYLFRGLIAQNVEPKHAILLSEIGNIINKPKMLFFDNYYETFFAIKYYYKVLLLKKLVTTNNLSFGDDYLLFYLQSCKNLTFKETQTRKIQNNTKTSDASFRMHNSGKVLCYDVFFNYNDMN